MQANKNCDMQQMSNSHEAIERLFCVIGDTTGEASMKTKLFPITRDCNKPLTSDKNKMGIFLLALSTNPAKAFKLPSDPSNIMIVP